MFVMIEVKVTENWFINVGILFFLKQLLWESWQTATKTLVCSVAAEQCICITCSQTNSFPGEKQHEMRLTYLQVLLDPGKMTIMTIKLLWLCWNTLFKSKSGEHRIDVEMQVALTGTEINTLTILWGVFLFFFFTLKTNNNNKTNKYTQELYCPKCQQILLLAPTSSIHLFTSKLHQIASWRAK